MTQTEGKVSEIHAAHWGKCLLHNSEDLRLGSWHPCSKSCVIDCIYNLGTMGVFKQTGPGVMLASQSIGTGKVQVQWVLVSKSKEGKEEGKDRKKKSTQPNNIKTKEQPTKVERSRRRNPRSTSGLHMCTHRRVYLQTYMRKTTHTHARKHTHQKEYQKEAWQCKTLSHAQRKSGY